MGRSAVVLSLFLVATGCASRNNAAAPGGGGDEGGVDAAVEAAPDAFEPTACSATDPRNPPISLSVQPDQGEAPIVAVLTPAQQSIRMMIYDLGTSDILTTVVDKAKAGLDVRVILDQTEKDFNLPAYNSLVSAGAKVQWSNPKFTYTHAKTIVVDGATSVISTGNFDADMIEEERDFAMVDSDPQDVAQLVEIFDSDWNDVTPDLSCTRLVVSPVNSQDRILAVINGATKTLDIEQLEFGDYAVQQAVAAQQKAGVAVRLLLADPSFESDIGTYVAEIEPMGLVPRRLVTPQLHLKSILADGTTAYAGSENMSNTSLTQNREVGLIITEPTAIATMASTFATDWAASLPFLPDGGISDESDASAAAQGGD